jgi:hypothetical protein
VDDVVEVVDLEAEQRVVVGGREGLADEEAGDADEGVDRRRRRRRRWS